MQSQNDRAQRAESEQSQLRGQRAQLELSLQQRAEQLEYQTRQKHESQARLRGARSGRASLRYEELQRELAAVRGQLRHSKSERDDLNDQLT